MSLSAASDKTVSVTFATVNGTANTSTSDYVAASGLLTFAPGETAKAVAVQVNGDTRDEFDETFVVNLSSPINATPGDGQGLGTILNDD